MPERNVEGSPREAASRPAEPEADHEERRAAAARAGLRWRAGLALAAAVSFIWHWWDLVARGEPYDVLWICNVAGPVLTLGCALGQRTLVAVPLLWLTFGNPMWLLGVLGGAELLASSLATHLGGPAIAFLAARRFGWPKQVWWKAAAGLGVVMIATRFVAPEQSNVNVVFAVWPGWEEIFPSYGPYFAMLFAASTLTFFAAERLYARTLRKPPLDAR